VRGLGVDFGQGFSLGRPQPLDDALAGLPDPEEALIADVVAMPAKSRRAI
jgi:EAL domain-containing protein (putative c-di-GMP-specific phosphodiesterase class I)